MIICDYTPGIGNLRPAAPLHVAPSFQLIRNKICKFYTALRCNPECRGSDPRWVHWNFSLAILRPILWPWGRLNL